MEAAHRRTLPCVLAVGSVLVALAAMGRGAERGAERARAPVELLSGTKLEMLSGVGSMGAHKTHVAHAAALARVHKKARGSKYQRELASLARKAGPDRRDALAKLEALRKRSEGQSVPSSEHGHKIPQALRAMENLADKRGMCLMRSPSWGEKCALVRKRAQEKVLHP